VADGGPQLLITPYPRIGPFNPRSTRGISGKFNPIFIKLIGTCVKRRRITVDFKLIDVNGVPVISLPAGYDLLEAFIGTNLQDKHENGIWLIDAINEVLNGKVEDTILGDVKYFVIQLNNTSVKIISPYYDDGNYCELPIIMFKNVIINWLKQKNIYYFRLSG
jgi:hypothetical protein